MINVSANRVEEMKHLVNSDLKNTHYEGIRTGEEAKPRTEHVGPLDNTNSVTTPVPFPKHRTHALPHDILVKASALTKEENHGKDELLAAEAHLAAIAEEKQIQNEEKERKPNAKSTHKTASVAPTKISRRMKRAIERARRARRDSDPALIESESGLIIDMAKLMAAAAVGGAVARFARMPIILGFIAGGIFCGPSGLNLVNDIRRMQTLASLGSVFMMFALGVGFPVEEVLRLRKLVVTSTFLGQVAIVILGGYVLTACGFAENIHSAFMVSTGLSVSSTSIVLNHLSSYSTGKGKERSLSPGFGGRSGGSSGIGDGNASIGLYGRIVLGMVACNELTSAFILSVPELVVPVAATDYLGVLTSNFYRILWLVCVAVFMLMLVLGVGPFKFILRIIDLMISLCLRCVSFRGTQLSYRAVDKGNPRSSGTNHRSSGTNDRGLSQSELQLLILTMVAFCLVCAVITNMAGLSLEMGAFIAGLLVARAAISPRRRDHPGRKNPKRLLAKKSEANSAEASFAASAADEALGTPSKPEDYTHDGPTNRVARGSGRQAFAQMDSSIFISIVMPLRIFFSFLYYATAGMALNPLFMFNNFHVIISFALLTSVCKAAIFTAALLASGAPRISSVTSGLVMSSVGEISLLYINKAHVLNETLVTRRMMLIYMASTIFSMILTPVILRLFVSRSHHRILHSELVNGDTRYKQAVMEMTTVAFDSGSQEGEHVGGSRRRKKEHNSDEEINVLPV
jgi:Kef-type K+ transport system membrane component KefB